MEFTRWVKWKDRDQLDNMKYPGVYALAISEKDISDTDFDWIKEIIYIGMTNSRGGLRSRLQQFENVVMGKEGHGGSKRVIHRHTDPQKLLSTLYVSVKPFQCNVKTNQIGDLLVMGKVAEYEFIAFSEYVKRFEELPEFNDKERSVK